MKATKAKGKTNEGGLDNKDERDPVEDADDEETEDDEEEESDDDSEEEEDDDEDSDGGSKAKGGGSKKKETEVERLTRERDQAKADARAAKRKLSAATGKLTKAGITDEDDDPENLKEELSKARTELAQYQTRERNVQQREAVREVLASDEKYAGYQKSVKYILTELDLSEDDIDPDTGQYDEDVLAEKAETAVEKYVKNQPKSSVKGVGSGNGNGPGGEPLRGGKGGSGKTRAEKDADLDKTFGGPLSRVTGGVIPQ